MRNICVVTGSRSEYGLLRELMHRINDDDDLNLQTIVTGMHLSSEFGLTYRDIEQDGFSINHKIEVLMSSDSRAGIAKSIGLGLIGFAEVFAGLKADLIVLLGDRFEIFSAACAALTVQVPIAHIHGGEVTEGVIDEAFRHSISKMAHLHFVAADSYRERVIQLGESPEKVFLVGSLGVDAIAKIKLLSMQELEVLMNFKFGLKNLLVTFHPLTLDESSSAVQMQQLLFALSDLEDTKLIFTMPNADAGGRLLMQMIREFVSQHSNAHVYESLGQLGYLSCLSYVDGVVGNSSSGIIEAPAFKKGVVNIGDRQSGRLKSRCIIDCEPKSEDIASAINTLYSKKFQAELLESENPYGDVGASEKIFTILKTISTEGILKKKFYDLKSK